jgi:hypothetical protein
LRPAHRWRSIKLRLLISVDLRLAPLRAETSVPLTASTVPLTKAIHKGPRLHLALVHRPKPALLSPVHGAKPLARATRHRPESVLLALVHRAKSATPLSAIHRSEVSLLVAIHRAEPTLISLAHRPKPTTPLPTIHRSEVTLLVAIRRAKPTLISPAHRAKSAALSATHRPKSTASAVVLPLAISKRHPAILLIESVHPALLTHSTPHPLATPQAPHLLPGTALSVSPSARILLRLLRIPVELLPTSSLTSTAAFISITLIELLLHLLQLCREVRDLIF